MNPRLLLPLIGAMQGALIYWLYTSARDKVWPATEHMYFGLFGGLAIGVPALIYLSHGTGMPPRRRGLLLGIMAVVANLA